MVVLGITGPIGSGKSYVASKISDGKYPRIDTDKVYHSLVDAPSPTVAELTAEFGEDILSKCGGIDRKKLSEIVFSDCEKLIRLNAITHKHVIKMTEALISEFDKKGEELVIVEVPLMFESGFDKRCDFVVSVVADEPTRVERIRARSGLSEAEAKKRIKNQKNIEFYIEKSSFTIYNSNNGDLDAQINALFERIFKEEK